MSDPTGERGVVVFQANDGRFFDHMTPPQVRLVLKRPIAAANNLFRLIELASVLLAGFAYYFSMRWLRRLGSGSQENQLFRHFSLKTLSVLKLRNVLVNTTLQTAGCPWTSPTIVARFTRIQFTLEIILEIGFLRLKK